MLTWDLGLNKRDREKPFPWVPTSSPKTRRSTSPGTSSEVPTIDMSLKKKEGLPGGRWELCTFRRENKGDRNPRQTRVEGRSAKHLTSTPRNGRDRRKLGHPERPSLGTSEEGRGDPRGSRDGALAQTRGTGRRRHQAPATQTSPAPRCGRGSVMMSGAEDK